MEEKVCTICGRDRKEGTNDSDSAVLIICENCLNSDQLFAALDQLFH